MNCFLRTLVGLLVALLAPASLDATALYQPAQAYRSGGYYASSIAVGDVNGDGKPDLLVVNGCISFPCWHGDVGVLLGNGDGTFQTARVLDTGVNGVSRIVVADLNGDGHLDVVVSHGGTCSPPCLDKVSVLLGDGDGSFRAPQIYSSGGYGARDVEVGDVNGDGKLDLLVGNSDLTPGFEGPGLGVLLGNGDGSFQAARTYELGVYPKSLAVGDVNGDGKLDVAMPGGVLLGNGDGSFGPPQIYPTGGIYPTDAELADVNGDGRLDLLVVNTWLDWDFSGPGSVGVLLGNGDGTFQAPTSYTTGAPFAMAIAVADVNGDGNPDLIVAHECGGFCNTSPVAVLLGNGDGTFKKALRYYSGGRNQCQRSYLGRHSIVATDVNGDAKPDLLVANECFSYEDCSTGSIGVLLGNAGVKTTTTLTSSPNPSIYGQVVTLTGIVTSVGPSTPTGTVRFLNGTTGLGYATLVEGMATLTKTSLPAGILSIIVTYNSDSDSAKSTSVPLSQTVKKASTMTTIKSSLNPSIQGQSVTFTATVTSPTAKVRGTVTFKANGEVLGTVPLEGQRASISTNALPTGGNWITAFYLGTSDFVGSKDSLTQTVK